uniref:RNA 3'-terminal phosphate cyclase domain-containing protein n=1 Tax=Nothoprocta perdicaria TaxID=30464 RepID=A0A8C6ZBC7_NOTPE
MSGHSQCLSYAGCNFLRQRLVLSTLSGRPLKIRKIRAREEDPGLRDFEASFIRLIDKVTNGSRIEINQTGTTLYYQPGLLYGGSLEHDCSPSRGIGYYLESLLCLAPFMKHPLKIVLRGVTNDQVDPSVSNKNLSTIQKRFLFLHLHLKKKISKAIFFFFCMLFPHLTCLFTLKKINCP